MFDYYVGIDWSGAKGHRHKGISVFCAPSGTAVPDKIMPPSGDAYFSRGEVVSYLKQLSSKARVLAGIDFAFAYPFADEEVYFPDLATSVVQPDDAPALWALVDACNDDAPDLYGGMIWDHPHYGAYYNAPAGRKGSQFRSRRRLTEQAAASVKSPSPTFNCVGPAGVGTGSLAGMRLCHHMADEATIWPFLTRPEATLTLVEIFPSYYFAMAGIKAINGAHTDPKNINHALAFFGSAPVPDDFVAAGPDGDDADALISAAALRGLSADKTLWDVPPAAQKEGWIFGVK